MVRTRIDPTARARTVLFPYIIAIWLFTVNLRNEKVDGVLKKVCVF